MHEEFKIPQSKISQGQKEFKRYNPESIISNDPVLNDGTIVES